MLRGRPAPTNSIIGAQSRSIPLKFGGGTTVT